MRTYSKLDLIGEKLHPKEESLAQIIWRRFLGKQSKYVYIHISIPILTYIRTETYCDIISKETEEEFTSSDFLDVIYRNFIYNYYRYHQHEKALKLISEYTKYESPLIINDYHVDKPYLFYEDKKRQCERLYFRVEKPLALQGELLLAEVDDIYGKSTNLEKFIEIIWIQYINSTKKFTEKKFINDFTRILKENDNE